MMYLYDLFRSLHLEWVVYSFILAFTLGRLYPGIKTAARTAFYVLGSTFSLMIILPLLDRIPFTPLFATQGTSIPLLFIFFFINAAVWAFFLLRGWWKTAMTYCMYYLSFIALLKYTFSGLFSLETVLSKNVYAVLDLLHIAAMILCLIILAYLFCRYRIISVPAKLPAVYKVLFFLPWLIVIIFLIIVSGNILLWDYSQQIMAMVMSILFPFIYSFIASGYAALVESQETEQALFKTRATLEHYRGMLELEDRIRKERHELKNHYLHIQILLHEKRFKELEKYLSDEIGARMESISDVLSGNIMIDYIISLKKKEAAKYGIPMSAAVVLEKSAGFNEDLFATALLNILDNAIEASKNESDPLIMVSLKSSGGYTVLQVKNRISRDVLKVNPSLLTTKSDKKAHGYGMAIIRSSVNEAGGMLDISSENGFFEVTAALPDIPQ